MSTILIGKSDLASVELDVRFGNRHGMIAGATDTGETVSLMFLAESFSPLGVPVVLADVKGDLAGLSQPANSPPNDKFKARLDKLGLKDWKPQANPVVFSDLYGKPGHLFDLTKSRVVRQQIEERIGIRFVDVRYERRCCQRTWRLVCIKTSSLAGSVG